MLKPFEYDFRLEQLILAHEKERELVVYDIHDGIVQYLTGAMLHFEAARHHQKEMSPKARKECDLAWEFLSRSIEEARTVMSGIHPPVLDEKGIVAALEYLIAEHHRNESSSVSFSHEMRDDQVSPLTGVTLFRIAQQALANIRQHSEATHAHIDLVQGENAIRLVVSDTGVGFDVQQANDESIGIRSMRNRVEALNGTMTIRSSDSGTRVIVELPMIDELAREHRRREKAESEARQVNERLRLALCATTDAIWDCDLVTGFVSWNEGYDRLFGERPAKTKDSWQWWVDHIHPQDRQRVSSSIRAASLSPPDYGDRWSESYRYQRVDGSYANIVDRAFIARDENGKPTRVIGAMLEYKE